MNLKELIDRPNETPIQEDEAYFILREYIKIRKGVDISPRLSSIFGRMGATIEVQIMHNMLDYAIAWLKENYKPNEETTTT